MVSTLHSGFYSCFRANAATCSQGKRSGLWNDGNRFNASWFGAKTLASVTPPLYFKGDFAVRDAKILWNIGAPRHSILQKLLPAVLVIMTVIFVMLVVIVGIVIIVILVVTVEIVF